MAEKTQKCPMCGTKLKMINGRMTCKDCGYYLRDPNEAASSTGSYGSSGSSQAGSYGSLGNSQGGSYGSSGSNQAGSYGSSGSNQAGSYGSSGSNQAGSYSSSGSNQAGSYGSSGSNQTGSYGSSGSNQTGSYGSSGSSQAGSYGSSGSNQTGSYNFPGTNVQAGPYRAPDTPSQSGKKSSGVKTRIKAALISVASVICIGLSSSYVRSGINDIIKTLTTKEDDNTFSYPSVSAYHPNYSSSGSTATAGSGTSGRVVLPESDFAIDFIEAVYGKDYKSITAEEYGAVTALSIDEKNNYMMLR